MKVVGAGAATALIWAAAAVATATPAMGTTHTSFSQLLHKTMDGSSGFTTNSVFSPYSVSTALAMLRQATTGRSQRQISNVLGRNYMPPLQGNVDEPGVAVRLFNGFFYDSNLKVYPDYIHYMKSQFRASVERQPFSQAPADARRAINSRVERETLGKVRDLIPPSTDALVAVLVSAIYMKADWQMAFDARLSGPGHFTSGAGVRQTVQMMNAEAQYNYFSSDAMKAIALPYKDERFQLVLVLPERNISMAELVSSLDVGATYKDMWFQNVKLRLPKFRIETKVELSDVLKKMGVREVFSRRASLEGMSPDRRLFISQVQHSAVIETDERGSEAAAATGVAISARSFWPTPRPSFIADRPFLFYIYDVSTGGVLFSGHVADAAAAQAEAGAPAATTAAPSAAPELTERRRPPSSQTPITFPEQERPRPRISDARYPVHDQFPPRTRPASRRRESRHQGRFRGGQQRDARRRKLDVLSSRDGQRGDIYTARAEPRRGGQSGRFQGGQPIRYSGGADAGRSRTSQDWTPWWRQ